MIEYEKRKFWPKRFLKHQWNSDRNTIQKWKKGAGARCSDICKQKALADQNSKSHLKRCWTAWNLTFSHRFWTIFSEPKSSDRDAYDAMVKIAYFQLIRTKKTHSGSKKTAGGQQKTGAKCSLQASKWSLQASKEHQRSIQGHSGA